MAIVDKKHVLGFVRNGTLHLIKSIQGERGNGIESIQTQESEENSGYNNVTITLTDGYQKNFRIKNGTGIVRIEQLESSDEDGGINTFIIYLSEGDPIEFSIRNGTQGETGPTGPLAIVGNVTDVTEAQLLGILESSPGDGENVGMTQAAITEFVNGRFVKVNSEEDMEAMIDAGANVAGGYDPDVFYYTEEE